MSEEVREKTALQFDSLSVGRCSSIHSLHLKVLTTIDKEVFFYDTTMKTNKKSDE